MSKFTVTWVGDRPKDWGDNMRGYTISVAGPDGVEQRNVKLDRDREADAPEVQDELEGSVSQHPRFADALVFNEGTAATPQVAGRSKKDEDIARSVAFKGAVLLVAAGKLEVDEVELYTEAFNKILEPDAEAEEQGDGIPF